MLELITGFPALKEDDTISYFDSDEPIVSPLVDWVQSYLADFTKMVDPKLGGHYDLEAMKLLVKLAKSCTEHVGKDRPLMDEVCYQLLQIKYVMTKGAGKVSKKRDSTSGSPSTSDSYSK